MLFESHFYPSKCNEIKDIYSNQQIFTILKMASVDVLCWNFIGHSQTIKTLYICMAPFLKKVLSLFPHVFASLFWYSKVLSNILCFVQEEVLMLVQHPSKSREDGIWSETFYSLFCGTITFTAAETM